MSLFDLLASLPDKASEEDYNEIESKINDWEPQDESPPKETLEPLVLLLHKLFQKNFKEKTETTAKNISLSEELSNLKTKEGTEHDAALDVSIQGYLYMHKVPLK